MSECVLKQAILRFSPVAYPPSKDARHKIWAHISVKKNDSFLVLFGWVSEKNNAWSL